MPELRHLEYLVAIAEEGTFSAAAEALHITQPALTRMMQRLEEELGIENERRSFHYPERSEGAA
jgi:DNA-binding transcriptional LysR family regulator